MTTEKTAAQLEAERQYAEALERNIGSQPETVRASSSLVPDDEEIKIMTNAIQGEEISDGVSIEMSRAMRAAWVRFAACIKDAAMVKNTREENVRRERFIMRDVILPIGHECVYARDMKPCKILSVSAGYARQPYYRVQFAEPDGSYRPLPPDAITTQLYARDFVNYGLAPNSVEVAV